jgi:hypothetical protein
MQRNYWEPWEQYGNTFFLKLFNLVHVEKWPKIFIGNHLSYG